MNYLVHLYLSDPRPLIRLGNLMGDFVKGRLENLNYPDAVIHGLWQHRVVDAYGQQSPAFNASRNRIDARFGYFRGIMVDMFYDHFLASNFSNYTDQSLEDYAEQAYCLLRQHEQLLPAAMQPVARRMMEYNWLVSYRQVEIVERALNRIGQRFSRPTPLADGYQELLRHYDSLQQDCADFIDEAKQHLVSKKMRQISI